MNVNRFSKVLLVISDVAILKVPWCAGDGRLDEFWTPPGKGASTERNAGERHSRVHKRFVVFQALEILSHSITLSFPLSHQVYFTHVTISPKLSLRVCSLFNRPFAYVESHLMLSHDPPLEPDYRYVDIGQN